MDEDRAGPGGHRQQPNSPAFRAFIASGWAPRDEQGDVQGGEQGGGPVAGPASAFAALRRARVSEQFPGERLVVPAGVLRVRSNDTDHRFRAHSAFAHLTGQGADAEPDTVLVLEPLDSGGHEAVLYLRPRAERDSKEFYADARYGELWVGARPTLAQVAARTGLQTRHLDDVTAAVAKDLGPGGTPVRLVRGADPGLEQAVQDARAAAGVPDVAPAPQQEPDSPGQAAADASADDAVPDAARDAAPDAAPDAPDAAAPEPPLTADAELARALGELRLVKDAYEVAELRLAVGATARGFEDVAAALPRAVGERRGERVVETVFEGRARREGNGVGYDTIAAAGRHACTLHWVTNDGPVRDGDLVLIDAGVEVDSLYTADVTRTLPVSGRFSPAQREVYEAVLEAADAAFAVARPGRLFRELHEAAMAVVAGRLHAWGLLPGTVAESLDPQGQFHRRWMVHGTSHHLGLDVHDCAGARRDMYLDAELRPGMVFTIEPGLYFGVEDELAPERFRGIGVRIEDDVLVTEGGCENLSALLPRTVTGIEEWMARRR